MKIKIAVVMPNMAQGGAEKVVMTLLNGLDQTKFDLYLILLEAKGEFLTHLHTNINIINLNVSHARYSIFQILKTVRTIQPHILFSSLSYVSLYIGIFKFLFPKNIKFIARESSILSAIHKGFLYKLLYRLFYHKFDCIIAQSQYMKNDLISFAKIPETKITIISNPLDLNKIKQLSSEAAEKIDPEKKYLIYVGRLSLEKQISDQIEAMQFLKDYHLLIIGDGVLSSTLKNLAKDKRVADRVTFLGYQDNPYKFIKLAKFLIMTSKYEGYPNVAIEAMSLGIPVISYDMPGGMKDILIDKVNGFLVEQCTSNNLAETIVRNKNSTFNSMTVAESIIHHNKNSILEKYTDLFSKDFNI